MLQGTGHPAGQGSSKQSKLASSPRLLVFFTSSALIWKHWVDESNTIQEGKCVVGVYFHLYWVVRLVQMQGMREGEEATLEYWDCSCWCLAGCHGGHGFLYMRLHIEPSKIEPIISYLSGSGFISTGLFIQPSMKNTPIH